MKLALTFILIFTINQIFAQTNNEKYKADINLNTCLEIPENYSTQGIISCYQKATTEWDKELNKKYKTLISMLTNEQKEKLKTTQRQWIIFRDKELNFSNKLYSDMQGTMWSITATERKYELTKNRTIELDNYIINLKAK